MVLGNGTCSIRYRRDICGLDVSVNDAFGMRGVQSIGDVNRDRKQLFQFHRAACAQVLQRGDGGQLGLPGSRRAALASKNALVHLRSWPVLRQMAEELLTG